jgi:hypothetical protein
MNKSNKNKTKKEEGKNIVVLTTVMEDLKFSMLQYKTYKMAVKTQQFYYDLISQGYMFRLRVIIRPSTELIQDYLIISALWDPVVH